MLAQRIGIATIEFGGVVPCLIGGGIPFCPNGPATTRALPTHQVTLGPKIEQVPKDPTLHSGWTRIVGP